MTRIAPQPDARSAARPQRADDRAAPQLRLTSMLDVCFLLLIFFVLTASFALSEGLLRHEFLGDVAETTPVIVPPSTLHIDVRSIGGSDVSIQLPGQSRAVGSARELATVLDDWRWTPQRPGAPFRAEDPVVIRPDATVAWGQVVNVYNAAVRARYENVNFAAARR